MTNHSVNAKKKSTPSFSGHVLDKDSKGNDVYKFFLPNAPADTKVVLTKLENNGNDSYTTSDYNNYSQNPIKYEFSLDNETNSVSVKTKDINLAKDSILAYKFILPNKSEHVDKSACINIVENNRVSSYTMATPLWSENSHRPRVMSHIIPDTFNVDNPNNIKRNHFNIMGGNLKSIIQRLDYLKESGFNTILGLPIFGNDNNSSHGYWTTNPYQITRNLGSIVDFNNLIIGMYKRGMNWTADGAFVNEGIPGIHIGDLATWGMDSPFLDMYKTKDFEYLQTRFGVFSKNPDVNKHVHIKLVNAPYKIIFKRADDGSYFESKVKRNRLYNPNNPSYIQLFDDRLADEKQINDDYTFTKYANKELANKFEIANYRDSVQAYSRRVSVKEVIENYKKYKEVKHIDKKVNFKNFLTKWTNFELVDSNKDGGVALWVGNSDIAKKQFIIPETAMPRNISPKRMENIQKSQYQVQYDTIKVMEYWTKEVSRKLTEYTARVIANKINSSDPKLDYRTAVLELIKEKALPESASKILEGPDGDTPLDNILAKDEWTGERVYKLPNTQQPHNVLEGVLEYPLEAIEFSPDVSRVFAYPHIKKYAYSEETLDKSVYDFFKMKDEYYKTLPEKFREIQHVVDRTYKLPIANWSERILKEIGNNLGQNFFDKKTSELTKEGREFFSLIYPDVVKFLIISAINRKITPNYKNLDVLEYDIKELEKININSLNLQYKKSPEDLALGLADYVEYGFDFNWDKKLQEFADYMSERYKNVNSDIINVASLIIDKTEAGLDWRIDAAKDVGSYDDVNDGRFNFDKNQEKIIGFWKKANQAIRKHNPNTFSIGELTDWSHYPKDKFAYKSQFSTISDYEYFYSSLVKFFGQTDKGEYTLNKDFTNEFYNNLNKFLESGFPSNINFAHRFVDNHDKPRITHLLSLDVNQYNKDKVKTVKDSMINAFENSSEYQSLTDDCKQSIKTAIDNVADGELTVQGKKSDFDSEKFATSPYDYTIGIVIEEAMAQNDKFRAFVTSSDREYFIDRLKAQVEKNMISTALEKMRAIWFMMNALPGAPTMFAGTEIGMTGWETDSKNEQQECRNPINWSKLYNQNYQFLRDYKDRLDAITKIRTKDGASPLVNGCTIPISNQEINGAAFYRYNDETDAICVVHANGFGPSPNQIGGSTYIEKINLSGLPNGLKKDTIYVDALNPKSKYKVVDSYTIKKVDDSNPQQVIDTIDLGNSGLILLRETSFDGRKFSFEPPNSKNVDARVKLVNTKYNIR